MYTDCLASGIKLICMFWTILLTHNPNLNRLTKLDVAKNS